MLLDWRLLNGFYAPLPCTLVHLCRPGGSNLNGLVLVGTPRFLLLQRRDIISVLVSSPFLSQREGPGLPQRENERVSPGTLVLLLRDGGRFMPEEMRHVSDSFRLCAAGYSPLSDSSERACSIHLNRW